MNGLSSDMMETMLSVVRNSSALRALLVKSPVPGTHVMGTVTDLLLFNLGNYTEERFGSRYAKSKAKSYHCTSFPG